MLLLQLINCLLVWLLNEGPAQVHLAAHDQVLEAAGPTPVYHGADVNVQHGALAVRHLADVTLVWLGLHVRLQQLLSGIEAAENRQQGAAWSAVAVVGAAVACW